MQPIDIDFTTAAGVDERWKWNMTASIGNRLGSTAGIAGTRDEACDAVERHYEVMKAAMSVKPEMFARYSRRGRENN